MPLRKASEIKLTDEEKAVLERYLRRRKTGRSMAQRAEIILRAASGENNWSGVKNSITHTRVDNSVSG